jgi:hypothetical protein
MTDRTIEQLEHLKRKKLKKLKESYYYPLLMFITRDLTEEEYEAYEAYEAWEAERTDEEREAEGRDNESFHPSPQEIEDALYGLVTFDEHKKPIFRYFNNHKHDKTLEEYFAEPKTILWLERGQRRNDNDVEMMYVEIGGKRYMVRFWFCGGSGEEGYVEEEAGADLNAGPIEAVDRTSK